MNLDIAEKGSRRTAGGLWVEGYLPALGLAALSGYSLTIETKMKETVVGLSIGRNYNDVISIIVEDANSGDYILELALSPGDLALALTGRSFIKAKAQINTEAAIGMDVEILGVEMPKSDNSRASRNQVLTHYEENRYKEDGWILHDDGTHSQQNKSGVHRYSLRRYVPIEDPLKLLRSEDE